MKIRLLGPLEILIGSRRLGLGDFGGQKPRQLMEILLTERGHLVSKNQIAELLWPEELPHDAAATIETYMSLLRRRLEPDVHAKDCRYLRTERPGYRLDFSSAEVDVDQFESLIAAGRRARARGDLERAKVAFASAIDRYQGDYLEDEPEATWTLATRERLRRAFVDLLVATAEVSLARGDIDEGLRLAKRAADADPIREDAARLWMLSAYALGRQDDALRVYERIKGAVARELGVDLTAATREHHRGIVRGSPVQQLLSEAISAAGHPQGALLEVPFLGRQPEIAALEEAWRDAGDRGVRAVLVEGEPGIGKSRLVIEFLRRSGLRCGRVKCSQLEADIPFSALTAGLADLFSPLEPPAINSVTAAAPALVELLPELGSGGRPPSRRALPPEAARIRLLDSVALALKTVAPTAIFIDDLQWTDASTIQALGRVLQRARDRQILIIATLRPDDASEHAEHWVEMARAAGQLRTITLEPLPRAALDALLSWGADPAELWAATGGHPLFLTERLRAGQGQQLQQAILSRYRASDASCQRLLSASSVFEREFSLNVLAGVAGDKPAMIAAHIEDLLRKRLLVGRGNALSFPHDLVRQAVYENISAPQKTAFHLAALETLAAEGAPPAELAHHALLSAQWRPAIGYSSQAGQRATELFANAEAAAHFERAVNLLQEHPGLAEPAQLESLLIQHARALTVLGRTDEAASQLEKVRLLAKRQKDLRLELEATHWLARAHWAAWTPSRALPHARKALDLAHRLKDRRLVGRAHAFLANPHGSLGENDEALRHVTEALGIYEELGEDPPAEVLYRLALIRHQRGDELRALEAVEQGEAFALAQHDETVIVFVRWVRALALANLGRYQEALNALVAAESAAKGEEAVARSRIPNTYGAFFADLGLWEEALDRDFESLDVINSIAGPAVKEPRMHALLNLAEDHLALGDPDKAAKEIAEVVRLMPDAEYGRFRYRNRLHYVQGLLALAWEQPSSALQAAETCLAEAATYQMPKYEVRGRLVKGRALAALGERRAAGIELMQAAQLAEQLGYPAWTWRSWEALAKLTRSSASAARALQSVKQLAEGLEGQLRDRFLRSGPKVKSPQKFS